MQAQVRVLEAQYDALVAAQQRNALMLRRALTPTEQRYVNAKSEIQALRKQIAVTKQKLAEYDGFASSLEVYLKDFDSCAALNNPMLFAPPPTEEDQKVQRLTDQESQEMLKECYREIFERRWRGQCLSSGVRMLGWEDNMYMDGSTLQFALTKRLTDQSAEALMQRTWEIVTTEKHMRTIQYSTLGVKMLHKINEDTVIVQRCVHHPQLQTVNWNNMIMFRLRSPRGYVVAYRTLYHPAYPQSSTSYFTGHEEILEAPVQPKFSQVSTLQWFLFEDDDALDFNMDGLSDVELFSDSDDSSSEQVRPTNAFQPVQLAPSSPSGGVKVTFAGKVDNRDLSFAKFYMFEVLTYIIRWENAVGCARLTFGDN